MAGQAFTRRPTSPFRRLVSTVVVAALLLSALLLLAPAVSAGQPASNPWQPVGNPQGDGEHYLGYVPTPPGDYPKLAVPTLPGTRKIMTSVDLSAQLPPIGDQGQQGSCVAWATSYYYKSWSEKQEHTSWNLADPTHQFSPSFVFNQINILGIGAVVPSAFDLMQNKGNVDIAEMPYDDGDYGTQPTADQFEAAKPYRIPLGWGYFWVNLLFGPYNPPNPIDTAKAWLDSGKMLVMAFPVYYDFPDFAGNPATPYYVYDGTSAFAGGHAVCICGYNDNANPGGADADHRGGFKVVNSWGPDWNGSSQGFVYFSYDFVKRYVREAWSMGDIVPDSPTVSGLSANSGSVGASIVINGSNFGAKRRAARVSFNGTDATYVTFTNEAVTARVPAGATSGPLRVYDWEGTASNAVNFTVLPGTSPYVTSIAPASGVENAVASITDLAGAGFVPGATARLERSGTVVNATDVLVVSDGKITCKFNLAGAPLGKYDVVVRNPDAQEARLTQGFSVTNVCGGGAGASLGLFCAVMGLLSLAGVTPVRKRLRRRVKK